MQAIDFACSETESVQELIRVSVHTLAVYILSCSETESSQGLIIGSGAIWLLAPPSLSATSLYLALSYTIWTPLAGTGTLFSPIQ